MYSGWENFYLLVGTASGALIGLLFVVATLTRGDTSPTHSRGVQLFTTPTVFHFTMVLVVCAIMLTPRFTAPSPQLLVGGCALVGLAYASVRAVQLARIREPTHWSDFWCYGAGPLAAYVWLLAAAVALRTGGPLVPQAVGASVLALLVISIRNAWDLVTWLAPRRTGP